MDYISIVLIALGLSMDSLAVSTASGCILKACKFHQKLKIAFVLALFQGTFPVVGWLLGSTFKEYIVDFDHWVAFGLLLFLGGKMIWEGYHDGHEKSFNPLKMRTLITLGVATSIDALVVGLSFALLQQTILEPALIIGGITFIVALGGIYFGMHLAHKLRFKVEYLGGIILIGLGTKILLEHTILA